MFGAPANDIFQNPNSGEYDEHTKSLPRGREREFSNFGNTRLKLEAITRFIYRGYIFPS